MTETEVFDRLRPLISEVTGARSGEITMGSYLMHDLGAESLDLLDLSFLIEEEFAITLEADEFEARAREQLGDVEYESGGVLTAEGLAALRRALPEVDADLLCEGLRKIEVPSVLNVAVFVHLIEAKLGVGQEERAHA